jgi:hypothetical protein
LIGGDECASGELPAMIHRSELVLRQKVEPTFEEERRGGRKEGRKMVV